MKEFWLGNAEEASMAVADALSALVTNSPEALELNRKIGTMLKGMMGIDLCRACLIWMRKAAKTNGNQEIAYGTDMWDEREETYLRVERSWEFDVSFTTCFFWPEDLLMLGWGSDL